VDHLRLGALQGGVGCGWWLGPVAARSRFRNTASPPIGAGLLIFAAIVWTLRRLTGPVPAQASFRLKITSAALLVLTFIQLYFGALVAGLRAGRVYNTWPEIDGALIPSARGCGSRAVVAQSVRQHAHRAVEHRMTAYALLALALLHAIDAVRSKAERPRSTARWRWLRRSSCSDAWHSHAAVPRFRSCSAWASATAIAVLTLAVLQLERLALRQPEWDSGNCFDGHPAAESSNSNLDRSARNPYFQGFRSHPSR